MTILWLLALLVVILIWLEWVWWRALFGMYMDKYFLLLGLFATGLGRIAMKRAMEGWEFGIGVSFFVLGLVAIVFGMDRMIRRRT